MNGLVSEPAASSLSTAVDAVALAPAVMAMRLPKMMFEQVWPWYGLRKDEGEMAVYEKAAAVFETYGSLQAELAHAMIAVWYDAAGGKTPDATTIAKAWQDICDAGLKPSAKRVRANYDRLMDKAA